MSYSEYLQFREEDVAARAHRRWLLRGSPEGSFDLDWFRAEAEIDQQFLAGLELGIAA